MNFDEAFTLYLHNVPIMTRICGTVIPYVWQQLSPHHHLDWQMLCGKHCTLYPCIRFHVWYLSYSEALIVSSLLGLLRLLWQRDDLKHLSCFLALLLSAIVVEHISSQPPLTLSSLCSLPCHGFHTILFLYDGLVCKRGCPSLSRSVDWKASSSAQSSRKSKAQTLAGHGTWSNVFKHVRSGFQI